MTTFDENSDAAEGRLGPLLTDEFLATLVLAVKTCGWSGDAIENVSFAIWCFSIAGKHAPLIEVFDYNQEPGSHL